MMESTAGLGSLLWGTIVLRPYVFAFLAAFLVAGTRDLGVARTLGLLVWGSAVAFAAEYASTRVGIPFGLYHYTGETAGLELYLSNVPFFDMLSFPFLAYSSFCVARRALGTNRGAPVAALSGVLMMLLDVVIDPLAVQGDRWFLGHIFYYEGPGIYFGVPLSNFAGWAVVGWGIVGGYLWATRRDRAAPSPRRGRPDPGVALYCSVLLLNLAITLWIGDLRLLAAGILVCGAGFLLIYVVSAAAKGSLAGAFRPSRPRAQDRDFDNT